jgi:hypothetical protein
LPDTGSTLAAARASYDGATVAARREAHGVARVHLLDVVADANAERFGGLALF